MQKFNLFSLFSGAGGIDLGFTLTNKFNPIFANDVLNAPAETYADNFHHRIFSAREEILNKFPFYLVGDVGEVDFEKINHENIDVVVGGPPCQDFSVVRGPVKERQGLSVKRGRLYAHFIRALIHIQPKVFVFENVPGLKSANKGSAYKIILDDFSNLGIRWQEIRGIVGNNSGDGVKNYEVIFSDVVDSSALGVPQRRRRLIVIGVREDLFKSNWMLFNTLKNEIEKTLLGYDSLLKKYPLTTMEAFEGVPLPELQDEYKNVMMDYKDIAKLVATERAAEWEKSIWSNLSFDAVTDYLAANRIKPKNSREIDEAFNIHAEVLKELGFYKKSIEGKNISDGSNNAAEESEAVIERMRMIPPDENYLFVKGTKWEVEGRGISLIYRRLHPLKPAYTVVAYGGGGTWGYHYRRNRARLTNRERARLQSFPDSFLFKGNTLQVRAQIGEAVPPMMGKKIAEVVDSILERS